MEKEIDGFIYKYIKNKLIKVSRAKESDNKKLKIPTSIDGKSLSEIGPKCFEELNLDVLDLSEMLEITVLPGLFCVKCNIGELKLPKKLTVVSDCAIENSSICKIQISDSVKEIGAYSLWGTGAEIRFPQNTKIVFGKYACSENHIRNLTIWPEWEMGRSCFGSNCIQFLEIKDGIKKISDSCFSFNFLEKVSLPNSVKIVGSSAFANNQISELNVNWENISSIGLAAFRDNKLHGILDLSDLLVDEIPYGCFSNNEIKEVIFNDYVAKINMTAFKANKKINLNIPGYAEITQTIFDFF